MCFKSDTLPLLAATESNKRVNHCCSLLLVCCRLFPLLPRPWHLFPPLLWALQVPYLGLLAMSPWQARFNLRHWLINRSSLGPAFLRSPLSWFSRFWPGRTSIWANFPGQFAAQGTWTSALGGRPFSFNFTAEETPLSQGIFEPIS